MTDKPLYEQLVEIGASKPEAWESLDRVTIERELELIDGMIEVQLHHARQCDGIANRAMAEKQKGWDMERVALLRKMRAALAAQPAEPVEPVMKTCGAPAVGGPCVLPLGHNMGRADVPENHQAAPPAPAALTDEQILEIAEPFGAFEYGDAQGHKRIAFARAIERAHGVGDKP